jgi:C-terminal processing protease CtpA/Prc
VHHTQFDRFETVDPEEQKYSACVIAVGAYGLADLDHRLDRTDMKPVEPRRMGVRLEGTRVARVLEDGQAAAAGWKDGDVVLSVDGRRVTSQAEITDELQRGGPKKAVRLQRGDQTLDTVLDYTSDADEPERAAREERRAAFVSSHSR